MPASSFAIPTPLSPVLSSLILAASSPLHLGSCASFLQATTTQPSPRPRTIMPLTAHAADQRVVTPASSAQRNRTSEHLADHNERAPSACTPSACLRGSKARGAAHHGRCLPPPSARVPQHWRERSHWKHAPVEAHHPRAGATYLAWRTALVGALLEVEECPLVFTSLRLPSGAGVFYGGKGSIRV